MRHDRTSFSPANEQRSPADAHERASGRLVQRGLDRSSVDYRWTCVNNHVNKQSSGLRETCICRLRGPSLYRTRDGFDLQEHSGFVVLLDGRLPWG